MSGGFRPFQPGKIGKLQRTRTPSLSRGYLLWPIAGETILMKKPKVHCQPYRS